MESTARITIWVLLLGAVLARASHTGPKLRRDGVLNLYPFPRVGRASRQTWQIPTDELLDRDIEKRQLYAFPRVGRSNQRSVHPPARLLEELLLTNNGFIKRESESDTGMWFGPRLGRGFRSEDDVLSEEDRSDPEQGYPELVERSKRQSQ